MSILIVIFALILATGVVLLIISPLRAARPQEGEPAADSDRAGGEVGEDRRNELEAAREAKYREVRDAELDYRTGKLSRGDFEAIDGGLRAEALAILNELEALEGSASDQKPAAGAGEG